MEADTTSRLKEKRLFQVSTVVNMETFEKIKALSDKSISDWLFQLVKAKLKEESDE